MARTFTVLPATGVHLYYQKNDAGQPVAPEIDNPAIDIDLASKTTAVKFLSDQTSEVNAYPVSPLVGFPNANTVYGDSFGDTSAQDPQQTKFAPDLQHPHVDTNGAPWFDSKLISPSKLGTYPAKVDQANSRAFQVLSYLQTISSSGTSNNSVIDKVLQSTVGYNANHKFMDMSQGGDPTEKARTLKLGAANYSNGFGAYATGSYIGQPSVKVNGQPKKFDMSIDQMQKVGLNILFDAVQGDAGLGFKILTEGDFTEAEGRMAVPSLQRIGKTVKLGRFTPSQVMNKIYENDFPVKQNPAFLDDDNQIESHGSFYNPYAQFDSLVSIGQIALAIAMILAFVVLLDIIAAFAMIAARNPTQADPRTEGTRPDEAMTFDSLTSAEKKRLLGSSHLRNKGGVYPLSRISAGDVFSQFLGIDGMFTKTYHDAGHSLDAGIAEFFGFSFGSGTSVNNVAGTQQLASTALRILTESGRMVTVLREIIRSGISVVEGGIADFSGGFSIAALGKLIRKIKELKIIKFINILRDIGDRTMFENDLRNKALDNGGDSQEILSASANVSFVDTLSDDVRANYIGKSRLSRNNGLAWSNRTAGMLALPLTTLRTGSLVGGGNGSLNLLPYGKIFGESTIDFGVRGLSFPVGDAARAGRIPPETVTQFEDLLEADYMPFYIHDLRTNEILSLHAFLEDAGEDFNIEWSTQEGYGRLDKVQIYKGTTRTVTVTFKMIATSEEDHAIMWYKLNKLAMVIYPQWTQGREITIDNISFIQPFSQIPGATPVIRLRLGDLWKSNYSKMAVARLFGASTLSSYNVDGSARRTPAAGPQAAATTQPVTPTTQQTNTSTTPAEEWPQYQVWAMNAEPPNLFVADQQVVLKGLLLPNNGGTSRHGHDQTTPNIRWKATFLRKDDSFYIFSINTKHTLPGNFSRNPQWGSVTSDNGFSAINYWGIPKSLISHYVDQNGTNFFATQHNENNSRPTASSAASSQPTSQAGLSSLTARDFYGDGSDGNPIVKAFKSSGGRGLAGVVTTFKVDHKGSTWGSSDVVDNLRAPIMVTVTLGMTVIHDITPGLDANGVMNAPLWGVGRNSNFFVQNPPAPTPPTQNAQATQTTPRPSAGDLYAFDPRYNPVIDRKG
jgi:hypothetical protein